MEIRPAPSTSGTRNGMPESGGYVYRGTGEDVMPWADSGDASTDYDRHAPRPQSDRWKCRNCGHGYHTRLHLDECGG